VDFINAFGFVPSHVLKPAMRINVSTNMVFGIAACYSREPAPAIPVTPSAARLSICFALEMPPMSAGKSWSPPSMAILLVIGKRRQKSGLISPSDDPQSNNGVTHRVLRANEIAAILRAVKTSNSTANDFNNSQYLFRSRTRCFRNPTAKAANAVDWS
jgi:hypothetical protein